MPSRDPVLAAQSSLNERDLRLLGWLYDHGVLTTPQITRALFSSTTYGQRRLLRLVELRMLDRFRPQRPDGGSFPYHYVLDQPGMEVAAAQRGDPVPRPGAAKARRHQLTNRANLVHLGGVNGFFTDLAAYEYRHKNASLDRWWPASAFQDGAGLYEDGDDIGVAAAPVRIRPDGHGIWTVADRSVGFFLEYDTGTEPLPILVDKIARYARLAGYKRRRFVVLFWLHSARREMNLHQRLHDTCGHIPLVFATAAADHAAETGLSPAGAVWWRYDHQGPKEALADLPSSGYRPDDLTTPADSGDDGADTADDTRR